MITNSEILVYEPNGVLPLKAFVKKYSEAYDILKEKIRLICYRQTNLSIEKDILSAGLDTYCDFSRKMAWKIGRIIYKQNCDSIKYTSDWQNCEHSNPRLYGKELNLKGYYESLDFESIVAFCDNNELDKALDEIKGKRVKGIGTVYELAVLFFASKGKYPIYDRFAYTAIKHILSDKHSYLRKGESKNYINIPSEEYSKYVNDVRMLLKELGKEDVNHIEYRDLDRALWIYGHGFK